MAIQFHSLCVGAVIRETAECSTFELCAPDELRELFRYTAGQHLVVELPWEDLHLTRCYSLSGSPDLGEPLRIGVKRVPGGRISNWLNDHLKVGDSILASVPEGRFVLDPETPAGVPLYLFAGGSGITPIISLLKSALATTKRSITVLYANRDPDSVIYGEPLRKLATAHADRVVVHHHFDSEGGHLTADGVRAGVTTPHFAEYYICGPEPFMELIESTLDELGVQPGQIRIERFVSPADPDRIQDDAVDSATLAAPDTFTLWLGGRFRTVPFVRGKTLLQCAQAVGLQPTHSCESGFCGSCMAHVNTGEVHMRTHEALSDRDIARGVALLCQSVPASAEPLELDGDAVSFRTASTMKPSLGKWAARWAAAAAFAFMIAGTLILRWVH